MGREQHLGLFREFLDQVQSGSSAAIAIVGELGIGKTRLLHALAERARAQGFDVVAGRGSEFEQHIPFDLVIDALDERFGEFDAAALRRLGEEHASELAAVLPSLASVAGPPVAVPGAERFRLHHAVRSGLELVTRRRPLVIALDDLHWGDPASLELVSHLVRRGVNRSLLVVTYRPRHVSAGMLDTLEAAAQHGTLRIIELDPLTVDEAAALLPGEVDADRVRVLHAESGGNPFFLEQLARHADGVPPPEFPVGGARLPPDVPRAVASAIARELSTLSGEARALLEAAAVAGGRFELGDVAPIAGMDERDARAALEALLDTDLVRRTGSSGGLAFRHPIVRRAVYDTAKPGRRLQLHRRAAALLEAHGAPIGARAHHVERSAVVGDDAAIALLRDAGHAAASRAPAAAERWFAAALRLMPSTVAIEQRLSLLVARASALAATGQLLATRAVLSQALEVLPANDVAARAEVIAMIAQAEQGLGQGDRARLLLVEARAEVEAGSPADVALMLELADNHMMAGRWDAAVATALEARSLARRHGDRDVMLAAAARAGWVRCWRGQLEESGDALQEAARGIDALADDELTPQLLRAMLDLVHTELGTDRPTTAYARGQRGLRVARAHGQGHLWVQFMIVVAAGAQILGRLEEGHRAADLALEGALLLDNDQAIVIAEALRCWTASLRGDSATALAAGEHALKVLERAPDSIFGWMAHLCLGEALVVAGQPARGRERIVVAGGPELDAVPPLNRPYWQSVLVTAALAEERVESAQAIASLIEEDAATVPLVSHRAEAAYARAEILLATGDPAAAAHAARVATECHEQAGLVVRAARARLLAGRAAARAGQAEAAQRDLEQAHRSFLAYGARQLADRAAQELRGVGLRVVRSARPPSGGPRRVGGLSAREHEVAELITLGYTNRQIAARLFISEKTIEKHVSSVLRKLGVSSRAAVAAAVVREAAGEPGGLAS